MMKTKHLLNPSGLNISIFFLLIFVVSRLVHEGPLDDVKRARRRSICHKAVIRLKEIILIVQSGFFEFSLPIFYSWGLLFAIQIVGGRETFHGNARGRGRVKGSAYKMKVNLEFVFARLLFAFHFGSSTVCHLIEWPTPGMDPSRWS